MVDFVPTEKGTSIRNPSTANFQINSRDRARNAYGDYIEKSDSFSISPSASLLNGFFTRLGVVEIVFDWQIPNVSASAGNNKLLFQLSTSTIPLSSFQTTIPEGNYQAQDLLSVMAKNMNLTVGTTLFTSGYTATSGTTVATGSNIYPTLPPTGYIAGNSNTVYLTQMDRFSSALANQLQLSSCYKTYSGAPATNVGNIYCAINPTVTPLKYVDIVCRQLTYNQSLKDGTTSTSENVDVLYRWNLAWEDNGNITDPSNMVIYQGYTKFQSRRFLAFPKQIKWTPNQPIGQIQFELYGVGVTYDPFTLISSEVVKPLSYWYGNGGLEWSMNLLVSEV
jgi:hypothetical protein